MEKEKTDKQEKQDKPDKPERKRRGRKSSGGFSASFKYKSEGKLGKNISLKAKNAKAAIAEVKSIISAEPDEYANSVVLIAQIVGQFEVKSKTTVSLEQA